MGRNKGKLTDMVEYRQWQQWTEKSDEEEIQLGGQENLTPRVTAGKKIKLEHMELIKLQHKKHERPQKERVRPNPRLMINGPARLRFSGGELGEDDALRVLHVVHFCSVASVGKW